MSNQEIIQLALGLADTLEGAEALQVGTTHIGDEATGRLGRLYQRLDVARMRSTHLYNGNVVVVTEAEQRLGNTSLRRNSVLGTPTSLLKLPSVAITL